MNVEEKKNSSTLANIITLQLLLINICNVKWQLTLAILGVNPELKQHTCLVSVYVNFTSNAGVINNINNGCTQFRINI